MPRHNFVTEETYHRGVKLNKPVRGALVCLGRFPLKFSLTLNEPELKIIDDAVETSDDPEPIKEPAE